MPNFTAEIGQLRLTRLAIEIPRSYRVKPRTTAITPYAHYRQNVSYYVPAYGLWAYASGGADHQWKTVDGAGFYFEFFIVEKDPPGVEFASVAVYPAIEIEFSTTAGHNYQVQVSVDLKGWIDLGEVFTGTGQTTARFIQARDVARFVRVAKVQ